jgi:putative ABC transport system permease protein
MKISDIFSFSFNAIKLRKLRAILNVLGIAIGIVAIVALLSITSGLQASISDQLNQGLSTNSLIVIPSGDNSDQDGPGISISIGSGSGSGFSLYLNQTSEIENLSPNITSALAIIQRVVRVESGNLNRSATLYGVDYATYAQIYATFAAESGTIPMDPKNDTIVFGNRIVDPRQNGTQLSMPGDDVTVFWLNATVLPPKYENYTARVSGVLGTVGGGFELVSPSDDSVYIPISTAASFFDTDTCDIMLVTVANSDNATITEVSNLIKEYYGGQVTVISSDAINSILQSVFTSLQLFLVGIAAISLLVAGVGIMNIMLVSLIERTREIGILKALGMKSRTVLMIFLGESVILGVIGAIIGIIGGWILSNVVVWLLGSGLLGVGGNFNITPVLSPLMVIGALCFGVGISVIFALYPAWRASKLRPVDALRHE